MTDQHPVFDPPPKAGEIKSVLIEEWLPVEALGIESIRESAPIPGQFPKLKTFHVWWARRPLAAAQGTQLAALVPPWDDGLFQVPGLDEALRKVREARPELRDADTERVYWGWIEWLSGIHGDAVAAKRASATARAQGERLKANPFSWPPAFRNRADGSDYDVLHRLLTAHWGRLPVVLDPTAGGGSIPFTSLSMGLPSIANDLNPVAATILDAVLRVASGSNPAFRSLLGEHAESLTKRIVSRTNQFFPSSAADETVANYLWVNTVRCPRTGGPVPLAPNWWLDAKGKKTKTISRPKQAVSPRAVWKADGTPAHIEFDLISDPEAHGFDPGQGTVSNGTAVSPWDGLTVDRDWITSEAQAGRMTATLYAVRCYRPGRRGKDWYFRTPTKADLDGVEQAAALLQELEEPWARDDVLPTEDFPQPIPKHDIRPYGFLRWRDFFTPRQLLVHGIFVDEWRRLHAELSVDGLQPIDRDCLLMLGLMAGKALDYNSRLSFWHPHRVSTVHVFERHDFGFKWSFTEFPGDDELWGFARTQLLDAFDSLTELIGAEVHSRPTLEGERREGTLVGKPLVLHGSATELEGINDGTVECINIDPPYYDNVMYAELADYFYAWEKRTLSRLYPERFSSDLTDKDAEAVANVARFSHLAGKSKKMTADLDYQSKMRDIFAECRRVLRDDGVMVVWFTHKAADAWNTLGAAIMDAGFTIETSWPVNTESSTSLNHAKKNSAKSTIVMVCRKRPVRDAGHAIFFEDIASEVRTAARDAAVKFESIVGHGGVDLLLSTYGPALGVLSASWPVMSNEADAAGEAIPLQPEEALAVARSEVPKLRMSRLVGEARQFDPTTDFAIIAWDTYRAATFPYDEARKLALGVGSDVDDLVADKVLTKSGGNVEFVNPTARVARRIDEDGPFASLYDAVCVMLRKYDLDGAGAVRAWLVERGFDTPGAFRQALSAYGAAVPRVRGKKGWTLEEARLLDEVAANVPALELHLADASDEKTTAEQQAMEL